MHHDNDKNEDNKWDGEICNNYSVAKSVLLLK